VEKYGGYESRKSLFICCIFGFGALVTGVPIIIFNGILGFSIFLWLFLFFGSAIVPNLMGIILSSLPYELRGAGNSVALLISTTLGRLPSPTLYGIIFDATKKTKPKMAYGLIVNIFSIIALFLVVIGAILRERLFKLKIKEYEISKAKVEQVLKINPNKSENENLRDNSEIKNSSNNITAYPKDSFRIIDNDEIRFKESTRERNQKKLNKAKELTLRKEESERNIIKNSGNVNIEKNVNKNVNQNIFATKRENPTTKKTADPFDYFKVTPMINNTNKITKRPASAGKNKKF
jgi:hypothetical protein